MRSRVQQLRAWLRRNGLSHKGKLAFITWYLFALDLLLLAIQKVADFFRSSFGKSLGGWILFLSLLVIVFFGMLPGRCFSSSVLWRLRHRCIFPHISTPIIPLPSLIPLS